MLQEANTHQIRIDQEIFTRIYFPDGRINPALKKLQPAPIPNKRVYDAACYEYHYYSLNVLYYQGYCEPYGRCYPYSSASQYGNYGPYCPNYSNFLDIYIDPSYTTPYSSADSKCTTPRVKYC